ncbi:MAG: dihydropteroate synthase [Candidatus Eisenbacteria bacterium]
MHDLPVDSGTGHVFKFRGGQFDLSSRTHIVGILNVTPDSFSDGGRFFDRTSALRHAERMVAEGADVIDVGGESTRPYAEAVDESEEIRRVVPTIREIVKRFGVTVSVDTCKAPVAEAALEAGAHMVNDVSALRFDPNTARLVAKHEAGLILMHMKGTPRTMQDNPIYVDVVAEITAFLGKAIASATADGVTRESIIVDPGIGFGKTVSHNLAILRNLRELKSLGRPILVGPSRKSFLGELLDLPPGQRLHGTLAAVTAAILSGASLVRVHDVKEAREAAVIADAIARG